jgi:predicted dehydrogenase
MELVSGSKKLRWGVLGVAKIATTKVIPAMPRGRSSEVVAIASRDSGRAAEAAALLGIPKSFGSYEALLADPDVDAVYIPLPNHLHVPWSTRAAEAGKHVLCEKPIGLSSGEVRRLIAARDRTGVVIQEAFMVRSHPQWIAARDLVREGRIGEPRSMLGHFSYYNDNPANIRNVPEFGGGALMDIGCYLITTSRFIFEREPLRVAGAVDIDPVLGVDRTASVMLDFDGPQFAGTCSMQMAPYQRIQIFGAAGRIDIEIPFNAPPDRACRVLLDATGPGAATEIIEIAVCDQYTLQADRFAGAVLNGERVSSPLEDSLHNMLCIEAVLRSARSGRWEAPEAG